MSISKQENLINNTDLSDFTKDCLKSLLQIPHGKVCTYQAIAEHLGSNACRAVGSAIGRNPFAPIVPCHRIIRSNGEIGGYAFGSKKKVALLKSEGIQIENNKVTDLESRLYRF